MNLKFALRFIREYRNAKTKNRNSESQRQALIEQMRNPALLNNAPKSQSLVAFPTAIQQFNEWINDGVRFTILERSHPRLFQNLKRRHGWTGIMQNHSGTAVAWTGNMVPGRITKKPKLAITSTILGGWGAVRQWHAHYSNSELSLIHI